MEAPKVIGSQHMSILLDNKIFAILIDKAVRKLQKKADLFDTIAFRGMSGAVIATALSVRLKKQLIVVRKPGDVTHSRYQVEGFARSKAYIVADDFVDTGETVRAIIMAVAVFAPKAKFLGVFSLNPSRRAGPYKAF